MLIYLIASLKLSLTKGAAMESTEKSECAAEVVGQKFEDLSQEELDFITGGDEAVPYSTPVCISTMTATTVLMSLKVCK